MARPREFNEQAVLDAAIDCFWSRGFEATSVRDLIEKTGLTSASLYNAFGDKRAIYQRALDRYVEASIADRIRRCKDMPPRDAIVNFFAEILSRSLTDADHKGCMLVNAALEVAPHDAGFQQCVAEALQQIELFFFTCIAAGKADGSIRSPIGADDLARTLLGVLMGVRVLARVRPEPLLLEGIITSAIALLDGGNMLKPELRQSSTR